MTAPTFSRIRVASFSRVSFAYRWPAQRKPQSRQRHRTQPSASSPPSRLQFEMPKSHNP